MFYTRVFKALLFLGCVEYTPRVFNRLVFVVVVGYCLFASRHEKEEGGRGGGESSFNFKPMCTSQLESEAPVHSNRARNKIPQSSTALWTQHGCHITDRTEAAEMAQWWRDGSVVKSAGCSFRGPRFDSLTHKVAHGCQSQQFWGTFWSLQTPGMQHGA